MFFFVLVSEKGGFLIKVIVLRLNYFSNYEDIFVKLASVGASPNQRLSLPKSTLKACHAEQSEASGSFNQKIIKKNYSRKRTG